MYQLEVQIECSAGLPEIQAELTVIRYHPPRSPANWVAWSSRSTARIQFNAGYAVEKGGVDQAQSEESSA